MLLKQNRTYRRMAVVTLAAMVLCGAIRPSLAAGPILDQETRVNESLQAGHLVAKLGSMPAVPSLLGVLWHHAAAIAGQVTALAVTARTSEQDAASSPNGVGTGSGDDAFGTVAMGFRSLPALRKFEPSRRQIAEAGLSCNPKDCPKAAIELVRAVDQLQTASFAKKLRSVHSLVNSYVTYRRDLDVYRTIDHWATPLETLKRGIGDCEDYAILKLALLARLGVPASSMSVVVLRDERRNLYHAVLSVRTNKGHLIMDNLRQSIVADTDLPHYLPLFSLRAGQGFIHGRKSNGAPTLVSALSFDTVAPGDGPALVENQAE